jgi:protoporphyrinogen oxidase
LRAKGVELRAGAAVKSIRKTAAGFDVALPGGSEAFDEVVVAAPPPAMLALCPDLAGDAKDRLAGVRMQGIVCASLLLNRPLGGYYVTNITEPMPFTAVIETSALVDRAAFGGKTLVYLPKYCPPDDPLFDEPDDDIRTRFIAALLRMYPDLHPVADVAAFQVARAKHVFAFPTLRYSDRVPGFATNVPGLWTASGAQIVNGTLNVNETLLLADRALAAVLGGATT